MTGTFHVFLKTTPPQDVTLDLTLAGPTVIDAAPGTSDADTTGYQVKFWGDIVGAPDEASATWQDIAATISLTPTAGDGAKTVNMRMRDDVGNATTGFVTQAITVDTTAPTITALSGPTPARISKVAGFDETTLNWSGDVDYTAFEVRVVPADPSTHAQGTAIGNANGSTNVAGGAGTADTPVATVINGADLEAASTGDGDKIIQVFIRETGSGLWSIA